MRWRDRRAVRRRMRQARKLWLWQLAAVVLLAACDPAAPLDCTVVPPQPAPYRHVYDLLPVDCDGTECLRAALEEAASEGRRGIGLHRGRTYTYDATVIVPPDITVAALGDERLPRPVLKALGPMNGSIVLRDRTTLYHLDIRGRHYGRTGFERDWLEPGVNAALASGWAVIGTDIEGFPGTCLLAVDAVDIAVVGSRMAHCGFSGLSLYPAYRTDCGRGAYVADLVLEANGLDGMDGCASDSTYERIVAVSNGWGDHTGDGNGLLLYTDRPLEGVRIRDVRAEDNRENGVRVRALYVTGSGIDGMVARGNGLAGLDAPGLALTRQC